MKYLLAMSLFLLAGCCGLAGPSNTITTTYPDGRQVVADMSDQGAYYDAMARAEESKTGRVREIFSAAGKCPNCTASETALSMAIASMSAAFMEREHLLLPEPRSGWRSLDNFVDKAAPLAMLGPVAWMANKGFEASGQTTINGSDNNFTPSEVHAVGQGNTVTSPVFSPPITITQPALAQ